MDNLLKSLAIKYRCLTIFSSDIGVKGVVFAGGGHGLLIFGRESGNRGFTGKGTGF